MDVTGDAQMGLFFHDELADGGAANWSAVNEAIEPRRIGWRMTDHNMTRSRGDVSNRLLQYLPQDLIRILERCLEWGQI